MYDLIVIGGGPAGLTATVYALRKRLNVLLVSKDLGGKTQYRLALPWIQEYQVIRGLEVVSKFKTELEYLDFARHMEPVERVRRQENGDGAHFVVQTRGGGELLTRAVIIATGVRQKRLEVPGEKEFIMRGLCYSALSYAPLFIEKETVVIGDGELALRSAAELATVAKHVHLVRPAGQAMGSPLYKKLKSASNVSLLEGYQVVAVKGDDYAKSIVLKDLQGTQIEKEVDGTFIEMGLVPNTQIVSDLVALDEQGRIKIDCRNTTSTPGVFAAGDVTTSYAEQVLVAVGEGAKAALSAYEYLLPML
jgi:alkyl hydroperoxide reductase subunit F